MRVEGESLGNPVVISFDEESGMLRVVSVDGVNVLLSVRVSSAGRRPGRKSSDRSISDALAP